MRFTFGFGLEVLEWIELGLLGLCLVVAFTSARLGDPVFSAWEARLAAFARRRWLPIVVAAVLPIGLRLLALPFNGAPQPTIIDEHGMLLEADTFLHGRVANATPPLWRHFETVCVLMHPAYASQYPPGQPAFLALGKLAFGNPWAGVLLGMGLFCGALVWALRAWLPPIWAFLGGCIAGLHFLGSYWMDSYFGGGVAALGGALVFGAMPRILEGSPLRNSVLAGMGLALVLTTRPYESAFLMAFALLWIWRRFATSSRRTWLFPVLLPGSALVAAVVLFMCYQNVRATANPFRMPYQEIQRQYGLLQPFIFSPALFVPVQVREIAIEEQAQISFHNRIRTLRGFLAKEVSSMRTLWRAFFGFLLVIPLVCCLPERRSAAFLAAGAIGLFFLAHSLYGNFFAHYEAPVATAWMLLLMLGWRRLRAWSPSGHPIGLALSRWLVAAVGASPWLIYAARAASPVLPQSWSQSTAKEFHDSSLSSRLETCLAGRFSGQHLVIVRYAPTHDANDEWVYNSADLNAQRVLWARDLGEAENRDLMEHYPNHMAWLAQPDEHPLRVTPLSGQANLTCLGTPGAG